MRFPDTPTDGKDEARAALAHAGARISVSRTLRAIQAYFPKRLRPDVEDVLDDLVADGDAIEPTSGRFSLTRQGLGKFRHHPNPRFNQLPT